MVAKTVAFSGLSEKYVGLAIATIITGILAGVVLQLTRRLRHIPAYFASHFAFFKGKSPVLPVVAAVFYYILLATSPILLIVWISLLGAKFGTNPSLPILFVCIFIYLLFLPTQSKLFYFKCLGLFISFIAAQLLIVGLVWEQGNHMSFYAYSAVMLSLNSIFVAICLWLIDGSSWNVPNNTHHELKEEIIRVVKIWKKEDEPPEIIDGGIYGYLTRLKMVWRAMIIVITYLLSLFVLLIYSIVVKVHSIFEYQATVNSVAVVTTDIILFMLILITKKQGTSPIVNAAVAVAVRLCIIALSGDYWFAGYCLLYLILFVYISGLIINKYYPPYQQIPTSKVIKTNIFRMPETPLLFLLLMFSGLVYFMGNNDGKTVPILSITLNGTAYPFWAVGVACILLSFSVFFYLMSLRIIQRARDRIRAIRFYYVGCEVCGEYYFFLLCSYVFLIILGFYFYYKTDSSIVWASCVFLPLFYQAFVVFYANWKENDYLVLGDMQIYNKKLKKKKQRQQKMNQMQQSAIKKMEEGGEENMSGIDPANINLLAKAEVQKNFMVDDYDAKSQYSQWRDEMNILQALKEDRLLPTDKKILISIPIMVLSVVAYAVVYFFAANRDVTAFMVSIQILFVFLCFIPTKRYFSTFETPQVGQIISFVLGIVLNYGFGIVAYAVKWSRSPGYTLLWCILNILALSVYAAFCFVRDKGLIMVSVIACIVSMVLSFGVGIILLAWFGLIAPGVAMLGIAFYYTYFLAAYLVYLKNNKSVPFAIYPITLLLVVGGCFAVMIWGFVDDDFDNFYGFSITYLAINLMILIYGTYRIISDIRSRFDKPNFYSAYGSPIYKYDPNIKSAVENQRPMQIWIGAWFAFYVYTILMAIFISDTNYAVSASQIFLIVLFLNFIYFTTYNLHRASKIKDHITKEVLEKSWEEVLEAREKSMGNFLDLDQIEDQIRKYEEMKESGKSEAPTAMKIHPKGDGAGEELNQQSNTKMGAAQSTKDISLILFALENQKEKAKQNDKILLVDFWVNIIFRCENVRKRKMLQFTNFIRDSGDLLADAGIAIVLDSALYDLQSIYNQAFQEYQTLSPMQTIFFNKQMKLYSERKQNEAKEQDQMNRKETEDQMKRQQDLERKLMEDDKDDSDLPVQKMRDSPAKLQKLKETMSTIYTDPDFRANNDIIPANTRSDLKGWKRPSPDSAVMKEGHTGMNVRQGMIGDCYLISAIGVLGRQRIRKMIAPEDDGPQGAYMVKFNKLNKDVHVIIDDQFPVHDNSSDNQWLYGRCEDEKEVFCNILEKAYAKLYGGYNNIVGGKVALALADMTGGFPEEIELKKYQESNTNEIFKKMMEFKKAGYLMGAGSPPNAQGDSVQIDGIYQGHAYLVMDVRDLDGNKIIKLRNPHGNDSKESELDWCDDSPKWTKRLKGLIGQEIVAADGAFWMGLDDFVYCYRALYVCRIFDDSWRKVGPYHGAWRGEKAAGLRNPNGRADLTKNPHYGIRVKKACTLFVELTQNEVEAGRAKNKIFFMVQRNHGQRIEAPSTNKMAGMSGPAINSKTISKEINLTADSFPYTFSLMTAIYETGIEGSFSLSMYCNDPSIEVVEDERFDS